MAVGQDCSQCPLAPAYPRDCIEDEPRLWFEDAEEGTECSTLLSHHYGHYFTAYAMAQQGCLPERGGWTEQAHMWIEGIELVGGQVAAVQRQLRRRDDAPE